MEWLTTAPHTVWEDAGELLETVRKWQSYAELVQMIHEMGRRHDMFNPNTWGLDDECFMTSMRNLVLNTAPASAFGALVAILAPYVGCRIHEVATITATLGDVEGWRQGKLGHNVR